ncbi:hypothetical protein [Cetobacterium sp. SF1]
MKNKKGEIVKEKKYIPNEIIDTEPSEIVEKFLDVSEIENEKAHSLVRIDINVIEYPLFTKNPRRKKNQIIRYFFNRDKEAYIQVNPTSGDCIPGEFEERVFIALLKIMRDKRYNDAFYTTTSEILGNMGVSITSYKSFYTKVGIALQRLSQTSYTFKNSLYSNKLKGIIDDKINTNIMNIRTISLRQASEKELEYFDDKRVKEIIKISISSHFYDNIIRKGYLVYDSQLLLSMDSPITRALYMLINKLRFNRYSFKVLALSLIKKIPLSDDSKSIGRSIKSIEKSCYELKKMDLIGGFKKINQGKLIHTEFEFFFEERHNMLKQNYFYDDKNHFDNLMITHTDASYSIDSCSIYNNSTLIEVKKDMDDRIASQEMVEKILAILPSRARELKTMVKTIKDSIRKYGFSYVEMVAKYVKKQKVGNIRSYFMQALDKGWANEYINSLKEKKIQKIEEQKQNIKENQEKIEENKKLKLYERYLTLGENLKKDIENKVYKEYIKICGIEGKAQKIAFNGAKESLIQNFLYEHEEQIFKENKNRVKINSKKIYENISMFQMELLDLLENIELKDQEKILKIVNVAKYFEGKIGTNIFKISYSDDNVGTVEIIEKE